MVTNLKVNSYVSHYDRVCGEPRCGHNIPAGTPYIVKDRIVLGADHKKHRKTYISHSQCPNKTKEDLI